MNGNDRHFGKERGIFICSLFFLVGGLLGGLSGNLLSQNTSAQIKDGLNAILSGGDPDLTTILLDNFALPLASLFLATSVLGWFLAPLVPLSKGYMLGWAISSAIKTVGANVGIYIYYGLPALIAVPCLIYITSSSIFISKGISDVISQRRRSPPANGGGRSTAVCLILLLVVTVAQTYLMPALIKIL